jgi:putative nucleotidyltransferase with HDIG domain
VLHASVCNPVHTALPTSLCAYLETRIASSALELPLLPHVASQVLAMSTSDETNARSLAELVHRDQAIAAHVLRVANAPLYRPRVPLVSLQQAISRLGLVTLREIVMTVSMQSRMFNVPSYATEAQALWQHAVYTAAYAREIARRCRRNVEGAFVGGLLHDVSKPVLLLALADLQAQLPEPIPPSVVATAMDVYHTQVGAVLALTWTLPPEVRESMVYHHDYSAAPAYPEAALVTCLADRVAYALVQPDIALEHLRHDPLWTQLNLYPDDVEALLGEHQAIVQFTEAIG